MGAARFSGISYMMCGFIAAWLFWPHTHTAIWIPWLLFAVDRYIAEGKRAALAGISVSSLFLILGGFPFVTALGFGAALLHSSDERRVGKACVSTCRSRWLPYH